MIGWEEEEGCFCESGRNAMCVYVVMNERRGDLFVCLGEVGEGSGWGGGRGREKR